MKDAPPGGFEIGGFEIRTFEGTDKLLFLYAH